MKCLRVDELGGPVKLQKTKKKTKTVCFDTFPNHCTTTENGNGEKGRARYWKAFRHQRAPKAVLL
ncbi:hypothetical protein V1477_014942 [Vespula maculifrons]|uniref:Uncharacterized protein n=1 Tax=Vespula maculifrons TaxID=7453 RepID=A0ABD2BIV7_VESMC